MKTEYHRNWVYRWEPNNMPKPLALGLQKARIVCHKGQKLCPEIAFEFNYLFHYEKLSPKEIIKKYIPRPSIEIVRKVTTEERGTRDISGKKSTHWDQVFEIWDKSHKDLKKWNMDCLEQMAFTIVNRILTAMEENPKATQFSISEELMEMMLQIATPINNGTIVDRSLLPVV